MNGDLRDYQKIFDCIETPICVVKPDGNIITCNKAMTKLVERDRSELAGKPVTLIHPAGTESDAKQTLDLVSSNDEAICKLPLLTSKGFSIPVETHIFKGTWEGETVFFGFSRDITETIVNEQKFTAIFRNAPIPMLISRLSDGKVIDVNNEWLSLLNLSREDVIGHTTSDLKVWEREDTRQPLLEKFLKDGCLLNEEVKFRRRDGYILHGLFSANSLTFDNEDYWVTCFVDQTTKVLLQDELDKLGYAAVLRAKNIITSQLSQNKYITLGE